MRLSTLALIAVLSSSASAFAPTSISSSSRHNLQSALQFSKNDNNNQFSNQIEDAKNAFLGTVTAATLFMGTLAPLPGDSAVANAATTAAPPAAATLTTKATTAVKKAEPVAAPAPLAAEKAAVASAKAAFEATKKVSDT